MRLFIAASLLVGAASAARLEPSAFAARLDSGVAATENLGASESLFTSTGKLDLSEVSLTAECNGAFDILNNDQGYLDAINDIFMDARIVGKFAGEQCVSHLSPSTSPIGGRCKVDASKFWDDDMLCAIPVVEKAAAKVLPPEETAPVMWLSERVITKSPFSFITFLGIELTLHKIFPIYVPQSCRNEADFAGILQYFDAECKKSEKDLKQCRFSAA